MVRRREALPDRFLERYRQQCLRLREAAVPAQKAEQEPQGLAFNRWMDVLIELCPTRQLGRGTDEVRRVRDAAGSGSGIRR